MTATINWKKKYGEWVPLVEVDGSPIDLGQKCIDMPPTNTEDVKYMKENYGFEAVPGVYYYYDGECYFSEVPDYFSEISGTKFHEITEWLSHEFTIKLSELNNPKECMDV